MRKAEQEVEERIKRGGSDARSSRCGVHGIHPELVKLLGMLKYRYSYAQNVLMHSIEAAFICGAMAAELGLNEKQARRAALLHDIGKALTHEVEGSHALIGGEIARKYGESAKIVNAIAAHHEEVKAETILAPLVDAADALSGARPGARREVLESYVKRLEDLETISELVQGGREVLRGAGGTRDAHHRRAEPGLRRGQSDARARGCEENRDRHDVSGPDPGHRHPGDARDGTRALESNEDNEAAPIGAASFIRDVI